MINRRDFLFAGGAFTLAAGCRSTALFGKPELTFGVVSDIHVTTPESCALFESSLRYFKRHGADAVMAPGDLTDWGLRSSLVLLKQSWDKVFAGTGVVPLFTTGNHDYDGWWYGDMTMEMHANGYSEDAALSKLGLGEQWENIMGEDFAGIRLRTVKGYQFLSGEWKGFDQLGNWMKANGGELSKTKPFFYFQHVPIQGTTADSLYMTGDDKVRSVLDGYPNCISFTGHKHRPFIDERSIWQGEFTAVATPSLSYAGTLAGYENGGGLRNGKATQTMPIVPYRSTLRGGQGYLVNVWPDRVAIERIDLEEETSDAPEWVIPLVAGEKPYAPGRREKEIPVPEFPAGAECALRTINTDNRIGKWTIAMECVFPSAKMPAGHRVFDYEIKAVPKDGSEALVKRFISPAFAKLAKYEPCRQRFWFDVAELPQDREYVIEVRARNCFGKSSHPIVSGLLRGKPGLGAADRS
jgi:hypothetical protein